MDLKNLRDKIFLRKTKFWLKKKVLLLQILMMQIYEPKFITFYDIKMFNKYKKIFEFKIKSRCILWKRWRRKIVGILNGIFFSKIDEKLFCHFRYVPNKSCDQWNYFGGEFQKSLQFQYPLKFTIS